MLVNYQGPIHKYFTEFTLDMFGQAQSRGNEQFGFSILILRLGSKFWRLNEVKEMEQMLFLKYLKKVN